MEKCVRTASIRVAAIVIVCTAFAIIPVSSSASSVPVKVVQLATATPQAHLSSLTVHYLYTQTAGNLNLVVVGWNDAAAAVRSVTDTSGNTYALAIGPIRGIALTQSIYF